MSLGTTTSYCLTLLFKIFKLCEHITENIAHAVSSLNHPGWGWCQEHINPRCKWEDHRKSFPDPFSPEFKSSKTACMPSQALMTRLSRK